MNSYNRYQHFEEEICTHRFKPPMFLRMQFGYMVIYSIEQADSMEQVEVTAERIAEVVQNNSAAAQETSATSEELTAQATTLSGMVSVFKLRQ